MKKARTDVVIEDLTPESSLNMPCCGIKSPLHEGRCQKNHWLQAQSRIGLRAKFALDSAGRPCGYIEYLPGEYAWRGVRAPGYMFIHCVWTFSKLSQNRGVASSLVRACVEDARQSGMQGVAVLTREGPWLASSAVFLKNGFEVVETADPDYQLLASKFDPAAANPAFAGNWAGKLKKYVKGLTIIRSQQCPHIAKFADEIAEAAIGEYRIRPRIVELKSYREAQSAPTPYAVFAVICNGKILADHQISRTRFCNIMRALETDRGGGHSSTKIRKGKS